jgi:hypothetical protein
VIRPTTRTRGTRTRGRKLGVHPLAHDTLEAKAGGDESEGRVRAGVRPHDVAAAVANARLAGPPDCKRGPHGEERLDDRTEEEPPARLCTHAVADPAKERASKEGQHGRERKTVGDVEGAIASIRLVLERARKGNSELSGCQLYATQEGVTRDDCTCAVLPVWKPGHPNIAENTITSL